MAEIITRLMTAADVDAVHAIDLASFALPWSRDAFEKEAENNCARYLVLCEDGVPVAYAGVWFVLDEGQITNIAVHPDYRRQGLGRAVTEALLQAARERKLEQIALEVRVSNEAAIALYKALGFESVGKRKNFYRHPSEDALVMVCKIK